MWHPPAVFVAGFVGVLNNHLSKLHNFSKVSQCIEEWIDEFEKRNDL